jgi:DNA-binding LacI/PurR family transcriptional regulator
MRRAILNGELKPHDQLPGELELVTQLGISRATIRRAWEAAIEEGLLYRVAGKGTYVSEAQPSQPIRKIVGFLVPGFHSTFDSQLLAGAESVLRGQGYRVLFGCTERDIEEENRQAKEMCADNVAGLLLWPAIGHPQSERFVASSQCKAPIVLLDRPLPGLSLPCVTSHNYMGGVMATQHLLELGHQDIAFLASPLLDLWPIAERFRAYQEVMNAAGLEPLPPLLIGLREEIRWMRCAIPFTGLCGRNRRTGGHPQPPRPPDSHFRDERPAGSAHLDRRQPDCIADSGGTLSRGVRQPSLVEHFTPSLTTIAQDPFKIGAEAARRLLAIVAGAPAEDTWILLPTRLMVRASTAPPAGRR